MTTTTGARPVATTPEQVHELLAGFVNADDAAGLASLFEPDGLVIPTAGAEARGAAQPVARRQPDDRWLAVIDHPHWIA